MEARLDAVEERLARIERALERIAAQLEKVDASCTNMDEHIGFVEAVYEKVKRPFAYMLPSLTKTMRALM